MQANDLKVLGELFRNALLDKAEYEKAKRLYFEELEAMVKLAKGQ